MGLVTPVDPVSVDELGRVHFTGIGGAGMSGIARIMLARGVTVSGSDSASSDVLAGLAALGAQVHVGHAAANIGDADTLVALASVMLGKRGIAVAGTHGKTTCTSMLTTVLRHSGADPSYVIGGILAGTGLGADEGGGDFFVAEADESDGSFLMLSAEAAIVTCVEADHLDNYPGLAEIEAAFAAFTRRIRPGGLLVACADDPGAAALATQARAAQARAAAAGALPVRVRTYGESAGADYRVSEISTRGMTVRLAVTVAADGSFGNDGVVGLDIAVPGKHNALNAAGVFAIAAELGVPAGQIAGGLAAYRGALRRLELKGEADGVRVLDSYAHHPTEVAADLRAARDIAEGGRVLVVFQPHLFSRTRIFAAELGGALGLADQAFVLGVYAAREDPEPGVTGELVSSRVPGARACYLPDAAAVPAAVAATAKPGDLVLTMGAGDVTTLGPLIVAALRARAGADG
jgi:UDP-N-acetylmuramate--alanine ligase